MSCINLCLLTCKCCPHQSFAGLLQRISAYNPQINAIREVNPNIVAEAAAMDAMLPAYQSGAEEMPLLFCVPMLVKDNFDTSRETHLCACIKVSQPLWLQCLQPPGSGFSLLLCDPAHSPTKLISELFWFVCVDALQAAGVYCSASPQNPCLPCSGNSHGQRCCGSARQLPSSGRHRWVLPGCIDLLFAGAAKLIKFPWCH